MRILLGSGGFRSDERRERLVAEMRDFFADCQKILFVPYALDDHDRYVDLMLERGFGAGFELEGIHRFDDPKLAVEQADAIYVGGGNTFRLLHDLYAHDLIGLIGERVRGGLPYMGVSAGTNVACPTMMTTNDMPIVMPPSFDALGLVPFQVNAHYFGGQTHVKVGDGYHEHFGETRDDRIREFQEMNETPVVGLWEGGMLRVENGGVRLVAAPARLFTRGADPVDFEPPAQLEAALGLSGS
jgi:dipeptidase E